jgi:hypothetical protein
MIHHRARFDNARSSKFICVVRQQMNLLLRALLLTLHRARRMQDFAKRRRLV